jgi:hypothetical protein
MNIAKRILSKKFNDGVFKNEYLPVMKKSTHLPTNNENGTEDIITFYLKTDWCGDLGNSNHIDGVCGLESFEIKGGINIASIQLNSTPFTKYTPYCDLPLDARKALEHKKYNKEHLFPKVNLLVHRSKDGKVKNVIYYDPSLEPLCYNTRKDYENEESRKKKNDSETINAMALLLKDPYICQFMKEHYSDTYLKETSKIENNTTENFSEYFKQDGSKYTLKNTHEHSCLTRRSRNMFGFDFKKSVEKLGLNFKEMLDLNYSIVIISNERYKDLKLDKIKTSIYFENDKLKILVYKKEILV